MNWVFPKIPNLNASIFSTWSKKTIIGIIGDRINMERMSFKHSNLFKAGGIPKLYCFVSRCSDKSFSILWEINRPNAASNKVKTGKESLLLMGKNVLDTGSSANVPTSVSVVEWPADELGFFNRVKFYTVNSILVTF